ncbi:MAG: HDIG domain-containing protein [candidate division Zixibacteria bacterium]|nr:HDIG domain-containing protein [candidate division Zixibacteria bacterium]
MFKLLLRLKRRIRKLLKVKTESRQAQTVTVRSRTVRYLILVVTAVVIGVLYPAEVLYDPLDMPRRGEFAREDIAAPFQISIYKSQRDMEEEGAQVQRFTPHVLDVDTVVVTRAVERLDRFVELVENFRSQDSLTRSNTRGVFLDSLGEKFPSLSETALNKALTDSLDMRLMQARLATIFRDHIYTVGVLARSDELPASTNPKVLVRVGERENLYSRSRIRDVSLANARLTTVLNQLADSLPIDVDFYYNVGRSFLWPNLTVNLSEYNRRVTEGIEQLSTVRRVVNAGDIIVSARQKVTADQEEILQEMVRIMRSQAASRGWWVALLPMLARFILVVAAFVALYLFLAYFRPDMARSNPKLLALSLMFGLQMLLIHSVDYLAATAGINSIYIYPLVVLPVMVTILFDSEVGILSTFILALLLGVMHRFSFSLTLLTAVVGFVGCLSARQVRRRSHFYRIMLAVLLAHVLLILVVEKLKLTPNPEILSEMVYGIIMSVVSIIFVIGILPVFESLFGITTDTTLLELSDLNHPLLKRLSIEAPGTYHHSISVGNLSESAAEVIGANALLARVGAYYHDIGKIEIPEYFVENQFSIRSKHDSLTPSMSTLILSSHVKKGRMLGEEADIPDEVLNFIEEHHGTMVMEYFYHRAKEQEGDDVDINKYRYPGPKPQTRETGIVMLADAVEAASRTLDEPKPARIDVLIQRIINNRFQSGELDECSLTLRDLAGIKRAFTQNLIAVFHHRVKYPSQRGD